MPSENIHLRLQTVDPGVHDDPCKHFFFLNRAPRFRAGSKKYCRPFHRIREDIALRILGAIGTKLLIHNRDWQTS